MWSPTVSGQQQCVCSVAHTHTLTESIPNLLRRTIINAESNMSDLALQIDAAIAEGREAELLAKLDIPIGEMINSARRGTI
jgi:hypothetical protein